ncbi:MAG TPA: zf-TFIIB domain-containing protein [Xanthomonadales bacterium]|nr:zf-TFIIB domain-containing protein [Xanthomonadales bacterium]
MQCPKCHHDMTEQRYGTLQGDVHLDQCTNCKGMWFDIGEAEILKDKWMSDFIDSGDPEVGKTHNEIQDIDCPRCGKRMKVLSDPKQPHIQYEACQDHGMYLDAGEFTDYKYETMMDTFRSFIFMLRNPRK